MRLATAMAMAGGRNIPTIPGTPYGGGYYVGRLAPGDGNKYALIVAPKNIGEWGFTLNYKNANTSAINANSPWDGAANSAALVAFGAGISAIADFMQQVNSGGGINGYADWFIPARYQLEMIYRNLKPSTDANRTDGPGLTSNMYSDPNTPVYTSSSPAQTVADAFKAGGSEAFINANYWSSTEFPSAEAWYTDMYTGYFSHSNKVTGNRCRLVRMIKI